jgi:broad specificity phosphatase PhoE
MRLAILRHLPTAWNVQRLLQGRRDEPILPVPQAQCSDLRQALARALQQDSPAKVLVSELRRTHETAAVFGYHNSVTEPLLNELDFGPYEGKTRDTLLAEQGPKWLHEPENLTLGEPLLDLAQRVKTFLSKYADTPSLIMAFGHGAWMRALWSIAADAGSLTRMNQRHIPNNALLSLAWPLTGKQDLSVSVLEAEPPAQR